MSKIIAIGDIHGRDTWKKIIEKEKDADKIIFIGDYFDSFDIPYLEQFDNFIKLILFKIHEKDRVTLILGNHDFHYVSDEIYSGYQREHADEIRILIKHAIDNDWIKVVYRNEKFLFTHAGVSKKWVESNVKKPEDVECDPETVLNELFKENPSAFNFNGTDPTGNNITQSPIWIRPESLDKSKLPGYTHVVGHTHQRGIEFWGHDVDKGNIILIDTLDRGEYLIINNDIPEVGKI